VKQGIKEVAEEKVTVEEQQVTKESL